MEKIRREEVQDLVAYEKARDAMRARIIELKAGRRLNVGPNLSLLFENRDTVLYQVQEMVRTERIVSEEGIQLELDVYNALIPGHGELSATVFIEIPDLVHMSQDRVRETVNRFQGLDQDHVWLVIGDERTAARFEPGHSKEEKMAAVHYVRFALSPNARAALALPASSVRIAVDHPRYTAEVEVPAALRQEMLRDLS